MDKLCRVAKRKRLISSCTSESVGAFIAKKPYYNSKPQRFDDLIDDLLVEIFVKLPAKILHRCKSVSKRWCSLISSSSFARSFIRLSDVPTTKMLLIKLANHQLPLLAGQVYAIPLLNDQLVDHSSLPSSFDFIPPLNPKTVTDMLLMSTDLVATYGGLVLLQAQFLNRFRNHKNRENYYYYYYVCNPITKHWVELPVIQTSGYVAFTCYYLQQAQGEEEEGRDSRIWADVIKKNANYDPNKIEFTVVSIERDEEARVFVIHVLSSADNEVGRWNVHRVPFPPGWRTSLPYTDKPVFANGKFHLRGENCIAAYDPFCKPLQSDVLPFPAMNPLDIHDDGDFILKGFEGSLRLVIQSSTSKSLVTWDLVDYGNKVWVKNVDVRYCDQGRFLRFQSFVGAEGAAKDKAYFLDSRGTIMLFDVKNKSFQHLYHHSNLDNSIDQPVEPFISSPWPTPVPRFNMIKIRKRKKGGNRHWRLELQKELKTYMSLL